MTALPAFGSWPPCPYQRPSAGARHVVAVAPAERERQVGSGEQRAGWEKRQKRQARAMGTYRLLVLLGYSWLAGLGTSILSLSITMRWRPWNQQC